MKYSFENDGVVYLKYLVTALHKSQFELKTSKRNVERTEENYQRFLKEIKHLRVEGKNETISEKQILNNEIFASKQKQQKFENLCKNIVDELQRYRSFFNVEVYKLADILIQKLNLKRPVDKAKKYIVRQLKDNDDRVIYFVDKCQKGERNQDWVYDVRGYSSNNVIYLGKSKRRNSDNYYEPYPDINLVIPKNNLSQPLFSLVGDIEECKYIKVYDVIKKELWDIVEENIKQQKNVSTISFTSKEFGE